MSPPRRRSTYKPRRDRKEVTIAVLSSVAIVVVTAVLLWVLRPNKDSGSAPVLPATSSPTATTTVPTTTVAPTGDTTAPAEPAPTDTTPTEGSTP